MQHLNKFVTTMPASSYTIILVFLFDVLCIHAFTVFITL